MTMATTYEEISEILAKLGPFLDAEEIASIENDRCWAIALDEEGAETLALDYDEETGKLFISATLGAPPAERLLSTYEYLLGYNLMWAETGGVRMALEESGGEVVMLHDIVLTGLTGEKLGTVLKNFVALMRAQQLIVNQGLGDDDDVDETPPHPMMNPLWA